MPFDPHGESSGIDFTEFAGRKLEVIGLGNPSLLGRLMAAIEANLATWSPGDEHGLAIKHVKSVSSECGHNVFRLKFELHGLVERRWRVFFAFFGSKRPIRRVLAVVDFVTDEQCYDDPSQQHRAEIRKAIDQAVSSGETVKKRK